MVAEMADVIETSSSADSLRRNVETFGKERAGRKRDGASPQSWPVLPAGGPNVGRPRRGAVEFSRRVWLGRKIPRRKARRPTREFTSVHFEASIRTIHRLGASSKFTQASASSPKTGKSRPYC